MTLNEFKMWLEGYLSGANISKEFIDSIFKKFKEVVITNEDISRQFDIHKLFPNGIPPEEVKPLPLKHYKITCAAARNGGCFCTGACINKNLQERNSETFYVLDDVPSITSEKYGQVDKS